MIFNTNKEATLGIDIGSNSIKVVEIQPTGDRWELVKAAMTPTPPESVKEGIIIDIPSVATAIKDVLKEHNIKATGAVCAISGSQVIVRQVQFAKMTEAVLRKSIKYEAAKHISSSMEDSVVEFEILGDADDGMMNVMLVAAPRAMIESRVAVLEQAGLEPLVIDVEAFALMRTLVEFAASDEYLHQTVALIDMGASHTDVDIVNHGEFALTRNIPIGGDSFTTAIKSLTGGSNEDAEAIKLQMAAESPLDYGSNSDNKAWKVVQPLLDGLITEIRRSINYYQSQFPEDASDAIVKKIVLTGGSAMLPGLDKYMASKLNIAVEIADVFKQSAISWRDVDEASSKNSGAVFTIGVGLALREQIEELTKSAA
ncbi:MAG: type IV pilus assembly protein PilM [Armatimonadota bacterium]